MKIGFHYIGVTTSFICVDGHGRVLMAKRSQKCRDEHGRWDTGGGKLELGLSMRQNVLKEVAEEYGCHQVQILEQHPAQDILRMQDGQQTHWVAIPFVVLLDPAEVRIGEPESIEELAWFPVDRLPDPLHSGLGMLLQSIPDLLSKHAWCLAQKVRA